MERTAAGKPVRDRWQADTRAVEAESALTAVICVMVLVTLAVGFGMGFAVARTVAAVML